MMQKLKPFVPDLLLAIGAGLVSYGAWTIYPPAGYIVAGAFAFIVGLRSM